MYRRIKMMVNLNIIKNISQEVTILNTFNKEIE